jgi:hypothetical protein
MLALRVCHCNCSHRPNFSTEADLKQACKLPNLGSACTFPSVDHQRCRIFIATKDVIKRDGVDYAFVLRHELAHCNGWKHPPKPPKTVTLGQKWYEAEGGKWVRKGTVTPMPKLPVSTKELPAYPPVVCITPDWKPEPCENRKPKDVWSTARPFQKSDLPKKMQ